MNNRRGGLGRGLGALIPQGPATSSADEAGGDTPLPAARFREIPTADIAPNPHQPRAAFAEEALAEMAASIREVGVLQPVVVREAAPGRYELVMGERRWRACQSIGAPTIPAIVRDTPDDALLRDALLENLHRQDLNPLEEAAAYQQLLHEFGATHEELAQRIGKSRPQITNTIRLLALPAAVQRRVAAGVLSAGHARALLGLDDAEAQEELAGRIVAEGLSVRATEELVALGGRGEVDSPPTRSAAKRPRLHAPGLSALGEHLSDRFDTRVKVQLGRRKGRIVVEFASIEDLERIVGILAPEEQGIASDGAGRADPGSSPDRASQG